MNKRQKKKFRSKHYRKKWWRCALIDFNIGKMPGCYLIGTRRAHYVRFKGLRKRSIDELAKEYIYKKSDITRLEKSNKENISAEQAMVNQFRVHLWEVLPNNVEVLNDARRELVLKRCKELVEQGYE